MSSADTSSSSSSSSSSSLPFGVERVERFSYRGKHYEVPIFDTLEPVVLRAQPFREPIPRDEPVIADVDSVWDLQHFRAARAPVSFGVLSADKLAWFSQPGVPRVLDLAIQIPDLDEVRLPRALRQFAPTIQRIIDIEAAVNPHPRDYFAWLTIDQRVVAPDTLQREAPVHTDGFQGARWQPPARINHSFTVSDVLPTAYYVQPFDFSGLDVAVHDFFWEMNAQVADTRERFRVQHQPGELTMMDCYCAHRGVENTTGAPVRRTWLRVSFEERRRVFDRLGNADNPLFDLRLARVERDVEQLGLVAFRSDCDPSLRVFPWQDLDGERLPHGAQKTKPRLRP